MLIDNITTKVSETLTRAIQTDDKLSVMTGLVSIYAFDHLKQSLNQVESVRLLFSQAKGFDAVDDINSQSPFGALKVQEHSAKIMGTLTKVARGLSIQKHEERKTAKLRNDNGKQVALGDDFKALWDRIKYKTTYRVSFDVEQLVKDCVAEINTSVAVASSKFEYKKVKVAMTEAELETSVEESKVQYYSSRNYQLPDIVSYLESNTNLTRQTVVDILLGLGEKLEAFKNNPQRFIELASEVIRKKMRLAIVDGITYQRIGGEDYYAQELFQEEELTGYLKNMVEAKKSVYDYIICDSGVEFEFAAKLESSDDVKLYSKLPAWFKIDTPLGSYNPDWAVLIDREDGLGDQLYFVVETKSSLFSDDLRKSEKAKIDCGVEHFKALSHGAEDGEVENPARFVKADSFGAFEAYFEG